MLVRSASRAGGCAIAVMAKASFPGRTKTRLVPPLSYEQAAEFNTAFLKDIADNLERAGRKAPIAGYMAFGPPGSEDFFQRHMPEGIGLIETWLPDFGQCLFKAVDTLLGLGHESACVLNSDSPTLPTEFLIRTAQALAAPGDRIVLGPAIDGGYYLLGLKQRHRRLFQDITWSTEHVARQTLERAAELKLEIVTLPPWYDVDDAEMLELLKGETLEGMPFSGTAEAHQAPHATAALRRLLGVAGAQPLVQPA